MRVHFFFLVAALALPGAAADLPRDPELQRYQLDVTVRKLANGMTLLVSPDAHVRDVVVELWFRAGSADEAPGQHGWAHLFEHVFPPPAAFLSNPANRVLLDRDRLDSNGATAAEYTRWFMKVPATSVEFPIAYYASRMSTLAEAITQEDLAKHQQTVLAEFRNGAGKTWDPALTAQTRRALFGGNHSYGHAGLGTPMEVEASTVTDMRRWYERFFGAANAMLIVVGNVETESVAALAQKHFGSIRAGSSFPAVTASIAPLLERRAIDIHVADARPALELRWRAPGLTDVTRQDLLLAKEVLRARLATATGCVVSTPEELEAQGAGELALRLQCDDDADLARRVLGELDAFLVTTPDIEAARQERLATFADALSRLGWRPSRAQLLGEGFWLAGDALAYMRNVKRTNRVSSGEVMDSARDWMKNPLIVRVRPSLVDPNPPDRSASLAVPAPSIEVPRDVIDGFEHGVRLVTVRRAVPGVIVRIVSRGDGRVTGTTTTPIAVASGLRDALRDQKRGQFDLVVVGDVERERIVALLGALPSSEAAPGKAVGDPPKFIATPGAPQTRLTAIAQFGPHVDKASVELAADLLRVRLNDRLREKERWVYGVDVRAERRGDVESIVIETPIRHDLAARAIPVIEAYLDALAREALTEAESARARGAELRRLAALSSAPFDLAGALTNIVRSGDPYDAYTAAHLALYAAVGDGDLKLPKPLRVVWSVAGDPDHVDPSLK